jgi:hypothetical protein
VAEMIFKMRIIIIQKGYNLISLSHYIAINRPDTNRMILDENDFA